MQKRTFHDGAQDGLEALEALDPEKVHTFSDLLMAMKKTVIPLGSPIFSCHSFNSRGTTTWVLPFSWRDPSTSGLRVERQWKEFVRGKALPGGRSEEPCKREPFMMVPRTDWKRSKP